MFKENTISYLQAFARKDVECLRALFAKGVTLSDWDIHVVGLDAVIAANLNIFNAVKTIGVTPVNIFLDGNTVVAELNIEIDGAKPLRIVDILVFDRDGRICAIRAYKG
jgi:hypothetical protein